MTRKPTLFVKPPKDDELPRALEPQGWPRPSGYANGMTAKGRVVVTGGVVGWDVMGNFPETFAAQARQVFSSILKILAEGGAGPEHLVRLTWYVTDLAEYRASLKELGRAYRETIGKRVWAALTLMSLGGVALAIDVVGDGRFSVLGALAVSGATLAWACDNTLSRSLSQQNPVVIVALKGLLGAGVTATLAYTLGEPPPGRREVLMLLACGASGNTVWRTCE